MNEMETEVSITELIRDYVDHANGSLDYNELAERIAADLPPEDQHRYLIRGLREAVAMAVCGMRPPTHADPSRSARWDQVKDARDVLEDWWVAFNDGRPGKPLLNCTPADLLDAAEWYEKRAAGYKARAEAYTKLANTLRRHSVQTPADLPREQVRKILDA